MTMLVVIGLAGIALLLGLILFVRLHPFVALLLVSIIVALMAGMPVNTLAKTVEDGLGASLGHIALVVTLGAMIGRIIEESGGAQALAHAMLERFGSRRLPMALVCMGFLVGIPVFFEVGVIMLMPLIAGVAQRTGRPFVALALPVCLTLLVVHGLLPPHPGAVAVAGLLHADLGRMLLFGLPVAAVTTAIGSIAAARLGRREMSLVTGNLAPGPEHDHGTMPAPPALLVAGLILLPILLICASTLGDLLLPAESVALSVLHFLGIPFVALMSDVLLCAVLLGRLQGWGRERTSAVMGAAIPGIAMVIMVTGGGAIFSKILISTGIGADLAQLLTRTGWPLLPIGFALTMMVRAAQGPTTVALVTAAGILQSYATAAPLDLNHTALLCLAMGCGGICLSHVNDPGFWIVTRLLGLKVKDGLGTWTVATTIAGTVGFGMICLLWSAIP